MGEIRKKETTNIHNFEMLKQSLKDELKFANKDMDEAKKGVATATEKKATAEGDLEVTSKELAEDIKTKAELHHDCMTKAAEFESETKSRGEELKALATAKKLIKEATSLAQVSFVQLATSTDLANYEVVHFVRDLAHKQHSTALAQLAKRLTSAMQSSDPF